jgi:preprotein translocase subunit SecG
MSYLLFMLAVVVVGMIVLMAGILMNREPGQGLASSLNDSIVWGASFFISFSGEFLMLSNV